jgi:hypothetical protein
MVKHVFGSIRSDLPAALVFSGWIAFFSGLIVHDDCFRIPLMLLSRVLP